MPIRTLFSGFRWPHHDNLSGYHHVVPSHADYVNGEKLPGGRSAVRSIWWRMNMLLLDMTTCLRAFGHDAAIIFYPEQTVYVSPMFLRLIGKTVVYVVHLDDEYWFERDDSIFLRLKRWNLRFVSHFIVLSRNQLQSFGDRFPGKVSLIRHGTWCDSTYTPKLTDQRSVTVVGDNYRDYQLMRESITEFAQCFPEVTFEMVGVDPIKLQLGQDVRNVNWHDWLSSQAYRELLSNSLFMFLPLKFATANNALLEAMSLGLPVVCSDVQGVRDYVIDDSYLVSNVKGLKDFYLRQCGLAPEAHLIQKKSLFDHCRREFHWPVIQQAVISLCEDVVNRRTNL